MSAARPPEGANAPRTGVAGAPFSAGGSEPRAAGSVGAGIGEVRLIGLTGGIGSGKSTVAAILQELGAVIVDADQIARTLTAPGGGAIAAIRAQFGADFITPDGALDRDRMRAAAFDDPEVKRRLEAIVHPLVGEESRRQAEAAVQAGRRCIVFDIPLLVESGHWRPRLDQVLVLDCTVQTQVDRVVARSKLSRDAVERIVAAQASRLARLAAADMVIFNDALAPAQLRSAVEQTAKRIGL
ncbi:MAG: dephospho-CoA kinase [Proteobacteria bacterium]|nr:dephospho-CoA kinase [Pseudomonadota bacterium]